VVGDAHGRAPQDLDDVDAPPCETGAGRELRRDVREPDEVPRANAVQGAPQGTRSTGLHLDDDERVPRATDEVELAPGGQEPPGDDLPAEPPQVGGGDPFASQPQRAGVAVRQLEEAARGDAQEEGAQSGG